MDMSGEQRIPAKREVVWKALNDLAILKACIPGCQELIRTSDSEMTATAVIKVGPVSAKFQGAVTLSDIDPPNGYRITGEGQGGVAGFAKGTALVRLSEDGDETILNYEVRAEVGGKLSQLGGRLIDATAKKMSGMFFARFAEEILQRSSNSKQASGAAPTQNFRSTPKPPATTMVPAAPRNSTTLAVILVFGFAGLLWYIFGGSTINSIQSSVLPNRVSPDFITSVLLVVIGAIGYLFGKSSKI
ncbi:MAG: carbon monoxide dehydrogenase subunit G [Rhizobiales bacterium]|nr:carbon monoxide dehydrogenase subunit G [Hyphomicrobiales bacterium]